MNADGTHKLSGSLEPSAWSNMSEAMGKRGEIAQTKGAKGMLFLDELNFGRYKGYFDYMRTNNSGQMTIASDDNGFFNIVLTKEMAESIMKDIGSNSEPNQFPQLSVLT